MTPKSPTWGDVRKFLAADKWQQLASSARGGPQTDHIWFQKALPDGRVLQAKISHSNKKTVSAGRFRTIARHELEVSVPEFWECIRTGKPVDRPVPLEEPEYQHPAWVVSVLVGRKHMSEDDVAKLSREEAERLVQDHWAGGGQ